MTSIRHRNTALCGAALCLLAVAIGAFGSHALKDILVAHQREQVFELANRYQFYHGLALLTFTALLQNMNSVRSVAQLTGLMTSGVVIFSGSLYTLALTNLAWLGAITPIGGTLMIAAWVLLGKIIYSARGEDK